MQCTTRATLWVAGLVLCVSATALHAQPVDPDDDGSAGQDTGWVPAEGASVGQNPPDFRWPWNPSAKSWDLELRPVGGKWQKLAAPSNSQSWPAALAAGAYEWRVTAADAKEPSAALGFTVPADAPRFVVPAANDQFAKAAAAAHPRYTAAGSAGPLSREAAEYVDRVLRGLRRPIGEVSSSQPAPGASREDRARQRRTAKREGQRASQQLAEVALALHLVRRDELVVEGRRRLAELASWDPHGDSGIHGNHLVARDMLWGLAALYDALYKDLDGDERRRAVDSIIARAADVHSEFLASGKMARQARNSHGWVAWAGAAAAIALVAGDDPRAEKLFLDLVPPFVTSISPWGGAPGGYGNGTGYGLWDVASLIAPFDIIGQAIGIDLYRKPWLAHVPRFFTYFLPPGAPEAPFGDAAEMPPDRNTAWTLRALSQRTNDPLVRWAAGQADPPAGGAMPLILSALRDPLEQPPLPPATPNSAYFEDVGWVAMHSALADRKRVSVYFKSSPYGSHNHSHADQNAIVVQAGGRALLKSSGYYDFYGSDHFKAWYQSTRASNAITFDGGKGQAQLDLNAKGRIVAFRSAPAYDVAVGDATQAYGGQLKQALRTVVYLRPDVVIVHDRLGSATARRWEWNVHADNRFEGDARAFRLESGPQSLCIDVLQAPPVRLDQQSGFQTPPRSSGKNATYTDQYHASLVSTNPSNEAEFVVALRISCTGKTPEIVREGSAWLVSVPDASRTVRLQGEQTEVR